ncbi:DivIVA domain-containing protein [Actinotalea sp. BY-33]|uniref:Cell wall synthesis protein Wag31 n=1 Tax=Actinotalea soli TaxID=2819234 RepID=A0A939RSP3_9CELL|nr:DivIVA domain-containing protein [Actinotalea soli]
MISAAEVRSARFTPTKFREGYEPEQVDALMARVAAGLDAAATGEAPGVTAEDVLNARFKATKFTEGYDQDQVDDFLDRVVASLRAGEGAGAAAGPAGQPAEPIDAARLRSELASLQPRRMRAGYDPDAVAAIVNAAAGSLDLHARGLRPSPGADEVAGAQLPTTWWTPGFDRHAVDALLARVVTTLRG